MPTKTMICPPRIALLIVGNIVLNYLIIELTVVVVEIGRAMHDI